MKKVNAIIVGIMFMMALGVQLAAADTGDAKSITKRSFDVMKLSGLESVNTLIIKDASGNQRVRKFQSSNKEYKDEGVKKSIMRFLEPADVKGTSFLIFEYTTGDKDNDMWIYMPALRKVRRVVSGEKAKSFMGSEFTNSDITAPKLEEYTYKLAAVEKSGDVDCWKIEMTPASQAVTDEYGYSKKITWIGKPDYITRKTEYYDMESKLIKTLVMNKVRTLDVEKGLYQAADVLMTNVQNGRTSEFVTDKCAINPDMKDDIFTTDNLKK